MSDFIQQGLITTLHDLGTATGDELEQVLNQSVRNYKIGLVLPVTAFDMRAPPFANIVAELQGADFIENIVVNMPVTTRPTRRLQASSAAPTIRCVRGAFNLRGTLVNAMV